MDTFAIWFDGKLKNNELPELEIHLNHWQLSPKFGRYMFKGDMCFLDIGLKITQKNAKIKEIFLYVPYKVTSENLLDLGKIVEKDKTLIKSIFNEDYSTVNGHLTKTIKVNNGNRTIFYFYCLDIEHNVNCKDEFGGTTITISWPEIAGNNEKLPIYFRFRLTTKELDSLSHIYRPKNYFLESAFSNIEIFEFRINEKRNLDPTLVERLHKLKQFEIKKIHLFVLRNATQEYMLSNKELNGIRELEKMNWGKYINNDDCKYGRILAYHIKEQTKDNYITDFSALLKFKAKKNNIWTILLYLVIFVILSVFANYISNFLINL